MRYTSKVCGKAVIGIAAAALSAAAVHARPAPEAARSVPLTLGEDDVIPTGNDWIALPSIQARDGALRDFNLISLRYRGLIEMAGAPATPLMTPCIEVDGVARPLANLRWTLRDYWIPTATMEADGLRVRLTYVAPPEARAAVIRFQVDNRRDRPVRVAPCMEVRWHATNRVTYAPVPLTGRRWTTPTPIDSDMAIFHYGTDDSHIAWGFSYVGAQAVLRSDGDPGLRATHPATLAPGAALDMHYLIGAGLEEYSAAYAMRVLDKAIDRYGMDGLIDRAAADAHRRTRTTGRADLDLVMNRNLLFTTYFAWGRAIDTEDFVGMTSRSNRYYVSAAYWDRDAMLWSFPALLDTDPKRAAAALDYALGMQARNAGVHSRFIDGVVLEEGFELDELVAPVIALGQYFEATGDRAMLGRHRPALAAIAQRLAEQRDARTGLYATFQDAQDEYVRKPFSIYDNALTWQALRTLATIAARDRQPVRAKLLLAEAARLKTAILRHGTLPGAPGATGTILAATVDGASGDFMDVPPGALTKLPALGFLAEDDPLFARTYAWLHGTHYRYAFAGTRYGLPGSYRLPFTTSWAVADHLRLKAGRAQALKILTESAWDGGIISEGVRPEDGQPDRQGLAFATAAGYVAHAICAQFCIDRPAGRPSH